MIEKTPNTQTI